MHVLIFDNLNFAVSHGGRLENELNDSLVELLAKHLESKGVNPVGVTFETQQNIKGRIFRTTEGNYNYEQN